MIWWDQKSYENGENARTWNPEREFNSWNLVRIRNRSASSTPGQNHAQQSSTKKPWNVSSANGRSPRPFKLAQLAKTYNTWNSHVEVGCLDWSQNIKFCFLIFSSYRYFLFTYITTTTVPSFPEIQTQYGINYSQANWTVAIPALGLSLGPLIWSSLADIYGRRLIFLSGTLIALLSTIGAAVTSSYQGYMAARFFQGFGVSPASTVGMATGKFQWRNLELVLFKSLNTTWT